MKEFIMEIAKEEIATLYVTTDIQAFCSKEDIVNMVKVFLKDMGVKNADNCNIQRWFTKAAAYEGVYYPAYTNIGCIVNIKYEWEIDQYTIKVYATKPYIKEYIDKKK